MSTSLTLDTAHPEGGALVLIANPLLMSTFTISGLAELVAVRAASPATKSVKLLIRHSGSQVA